MSPDEMKARTTQFYEEAINRHDLDAFQDYLTDDFVDHDAPPGTPPGVDGIRQMFAGFLAAFPDLEMRPDRMYVDGDTVVTRITMTGTHDGEFMGIPPTGKSFTSRGIDIIRPEGDKAAERWGNFDDLSMLRQLGVLPEM